MERERTVPGPRWGDCAPTPGSIGGSTLPLALPVLTRDCTSRKWSLVRSSRSSSSNFSREGYSVTKTSSKYHVTDLCRRGFRRTSPEMRRARAGRRSTGVQATVRSPADVEGGTGPVQIGRRLRAHWGAGPGANLTAQTQLALESQPCLGLLWGPCHDWPSENKDDRT